MSDPKDRRASSREPVHLVTTIVRDGNEIGCGVSRDASGTGLLLFTHVDLPAQTEVTLRLFVPPSDEPRELNATIVRAERIAPTEKLVWDYRLAIALQDPPPDLQALVRSLSKRPPPPV